MGARLGKAHAQAAKVDRVLDVVIDKCVAKCPKKCCVPMSWLWRYEGQPLKLPNPGADQMRGTGHLLLCCFEPDLALASVLCPCFLYACNERFVDERNDCGGLCAPAFFLAPPCMIAWTRAKTRSLMGLPDEPWIVDMSAAMCCPCCTLVQSSRALRRVALDNRIGFDNPFGLSAPKAAGMDR